MSIDPSKLRHILVLFGAELPERVSDPEELAALLGEANEVLPWLHLRANVLARHNEIEEVLEKLARMQPAAGTSRSGRSPQNILAAAAVAAYDDALEALVRDSAERQDLALALDERLIELIHADTSFQSVHFRDCIKVP